MVATAGRVNQKDLVQCFADMAQGYGERHELNKDKEFRHDSGWGAVYKRPAVSQGEPSYGAERSTLPCWEDFGFDRIVEYDTPIIHARKASKGSVKVENTHPFMKENSGRRYFFCHNGTVKGGLPKYDDLEGESDSESLMVYLLEGMNNDGLADFVQAAERLERPGIDYTAVNSFLLDEGRKRLFALNKHRKNPLYYTMKVGRGDGVVIISSEILPNIPVEWTQMENGQAAVIDLSKATIELS